MFFMYYIKVSAMLKKIVYTAFLSFVLSVVLNAQSFNRDSFFRTFAAKPQDTLRLGVILDYLNSERHDINPDDWEYLARLLLQDAIAQENQDWQKKGYLELFSYHYQQGELDSALYYIDTILAPMVEKSGSLSEKAVVAANRGMLYIARGDYDAAVEYTAEALVMDSILNQRQTMAKHNIQLGKIYYYRGDYDLAAKSYHRGLDIAEAIHDSSLISEALTCLGVLDLNQGEYDSALKYLRSCLEIDMKGGSKWYIAADYNNLGLVFDYKEQFDSAVYYHSKALDLYEELGDKMGISNIYNDLGIVYEAMSDYTQAENYYLKSLKIKEEIGNPEKIVSALINLGSMYTDMGRYERAEELLNRGIQMARETGNKEWLRKLTKYLYLNYKTKGDFAKALGYLEESKSLSDSIFSIEKTKVIEALKQKYEASEKDKKLAEFRAENAKAQSALSRQRFQKTLAIASFVVVTILFVFFSREKRKNDKILEHNIRWLRSQNAELLEAIEKLHAKKISSQDLLEQRIMLTNNEKTVLRLGDIIYVEAEKNAVKLVTMNGKVWEWQNLKKTQHK